MVTLPKQTKKGFTIIEVVLVLAVAGLIFLMVFIAFPALQRAQQNSQRTDDMARVQSALLSWQGNHSNSLPTPSAGDSFSFDASSADNVEQDSGLIQLSGNACDRACQFVRDYLNEAASADGNTSASGTNQHYDTFKDPSGEYYSIVFTKNLSGNNSDISNVSFHNSATEGIVTLQPITLDGQVSEGYTLDGQVDAYAMFVLPGTTCQEDAAVKSQKNNFSVLYLLDGSGVKCTSSN